MVPLLVRLHYRLGLGGRYAYDRDRSVIVLDVMVVDQQYVVPTRVTDKG